MHKCLFIKIKPQIFHICCSQLFSRSTAIGLKVYQRLEEPDLKDCHGTAQFTLMVNNLFDALNVKLPKFGITSSSKEVEVTIILYSICCTVVK